MQSESCEKKQASAEPLCEECEGPLYNEPLFDNACVGLCPKCFEAAIERGHLIFEASNDVAKSKIS